MNSQKIKQLFVQEVSRILVLILSGWLAGYFLLTPGYGISLLLLVYLGVQLVSFYRLISWLNQGLPGQIPRCFGIWRALGEFLYLNRQRQISSTRNIRKKFHRIAQVTHAIDEGIVILDQKNRLDWWNRGASELLGLQAEDRGLELINLIRDSRFSEYLEIADFQHALELPSKLNIKKWLSFTAHRYGQGETVLLVTDITRMKKVELVRKDFVGNVSHELRTPLTVLRGYLETLVDSGMIENPRALKAFDQMKGQVQRMQNMADDLIVLSKLEMESDYTIRESRIIELEPFFQRLVDEAMVVSEGRHKFIISCDPGLTINAVPEDFHSALSNLVINAVKHNPEGITIKLTADSSEGYINIHVIDNGVGISAEVIPRLTERFYRADSSRSSANGGTGLGLAIVKHIVNRLQGQLLISSRLGEGSDFHCRFPVTVNED